MIRKMVLEDLQQASTVHSEAFPRQTRSFDWLKSTFNAYPRMLCYVATAREEVLAYIVWSQKSGFRPEAVLELEQLAVRPTFQGQGIGKKLIRESLELVRSDLLELGSRLKHVIVTTRADNHAQAIYRDVLNAEVEATITNLYSADEVFMIARNI